MKYWVLRSIKFDFVYYTILNKGVVKFNIAFVFSHIVALSKSFNSLSNIILVIIIFGGIYDEF